jgi:hypothetical protein
VVVAAVVQTRALRRNLIRHRPRPPPRRRHTRNPMLSLQTSLLRLTSMMEEEKGVGALTLFLFFRVAQAPKSTFTRADDIGNAHRVCYS